MSNIFINCPTTGIPVPTGLTTNSVVFHSLPPVAVPLCCAACGKMHKWKPQDAWIGRRNSAWALGALDDSRAVSALIDALRDSEAPVREQVAWALGAIDNPQAVPALVAAGAVAALGIARKRVPHEQEELEAALETA